MAKYLFGFIGTGNMGGALVEAACKTLDPSCILLANRTRVKAEKLAERLGCDVGSNEDVVSQCEYIFLGVKPQMMADTLAPLQGLLAARQDSFILVSMAAGLRMEKISALAGGTYPVIRLMPNTACAVEAGLVLHDRNALVSDAQLQVFLDAMVRSGWLEQLDEHLMEAGSAVAGCGGAFICQFLEGLADGGVACGLPRAKAQRFAAQMAFGTAKLILESGKHTGQLKDEVCSPAGSTIQGVRILEERAVRGAAMDAAIAAWQRGKELG